MVEKTEAAVLLTRQGAERGSRMARGLRAGPQDPVLRIV
jgi:hypothetical protein